MNKKSDLEDTLLADSEKAREQLLLALQAMPKSAGCELLLRRNGKNSWVKMPTDDDFSHFYRNAIKDSIIEASSLGLCLLEYDAMSTGENMGVAYTAEVAAFLEGFPKKGAAQKFKGDEGSFSSMRQRCARISLPGGNELLAFGPSSLKSVAALNQSSVFGLFQSGKIVQPASSGYLNIGRKVTFFVFKEYVFVVDNSNFSSMTNFREVVRKRAQVAIGKLTSLKFLKIGNIPQLKELCNSSPDFARRISASDARGFFKSITRKGLLETMANFEVTFEHDDDGKVITLNPDFSVASEKRQFQKLMTQVFVKCAVTGDPMEALKIIPFKKT